MRTKRVAVGMFMVMMLVSIQVGLVSAQTAPPPDQLTAAQMLHATVVKDGLLNSRTAGDGPVFRFASCTDAATWNSPCYFIVSGQGSFVTSSFKGRGLNSLVPVKSASFNSDISCGINVYNFLGVVGADRTPILGPLEVTVSRA
jgi:hypothetical protein